MGEENREFSFDWRVEEDGMIALGMEAAPDGGVGWLFEAQALGSECGAPV